MSKNDQRSLERERKIPQIEKKGDMNTVRRDGKKGEGETLMNNNTSTPHTV
jgi:hypothetical protein